MKGVELPINILVIVAVAVIVLLGIIALYMGGFGPFSASVSYQAAKNAGCDELVRLGCGDTTTVIVNFDSGGDGTAGNAGDTLQALCEGWYGVTAGSQLECRQQCGCPVTG